MFRYIGNKTKLLPAIMEATQEAIGESGTVVDLMAGTGSVALEYRRSGYSVIASDSFCTMLHHLSLASADCSPRRTDITGSLSTSMNSDLYKAISFRNFRPQALQRTDVPPENTLLPLMQPESMRLENRLENGSKTAVLQTMRPPC